MDTIYIAFLCFMLLLCNIGNVFGLESALTSNENPLGDVKCNAVSLCVHHLQSEYCHEKVGVKG